VVLIFAVGIFGYYKVTAPTPIIEEQIKHELSFDVSVTSSEQDVIKDAVKRQHLEITGAVVASVKTSQTVSDDSKVLQAYVPVTSFNAVRQAVSIAELATAKVLLHQDIDQTAQAALAGALGIDGDSMSTISEPLDELLETDIAFIPVDSLTSAVKLLRFDDVYYLDSLNSGAIFRELVFEGEGALALSGLTLDKLFSESQVYKVNMTGVTALTRIMQRKLASVGDPLYFSAKIGDFLADADLTHVSNEVSFKPGCSYSNTLFCSPPEFIETLKASGVDLVELTGNHNNDLGSEFNTQTIELYNSLEWGTVGGGLNVADAREPFVDTQKGSNVTFLAYNFPDSPNGGAIAGENKAGANSFDLATIQKDIEFAKEQADFVVVNVQFWECYAYPDGYLEFPQCDKPIGQQEQTFKKLIDLGADMVVGSSAHQPQTYELYNGKPIYYGLGNLYFDQTSWPGTERGIVLTHYFVAGKLLQTKLTPTVFDKDLQTRVMTDAEADFLLTRLHDAR